MDLKDMMLPFGKWALGKPPGPGPTPKRNTWVRLTEDQLRLGKPGRTEGNALQLLLCGNEALPRMLETIAAAKETVHLQTMHFFADSAGREIHHALQTKAKQGISVHVNFEIMNTAYGDPKSRKERPPESVKTMVAEMREHGIEVKDSGESIPKLVETKRPRI